MANGESFLLEIEKCPALRRSPSCLILILDSKINFPRRHLCAIHRAITGGEKIKKALKILEIGSYLKRMVHEIPGLKVFITGSSVLELANSVGEPLTGRGRVSDIPIECRRVDPTRFTLEQNL
jgi:hypothetical protein